LQKKGEKIERGRQRDRGEEYKNLLKGNSKKSWVGEKEKKREIAGKKSKEQRDKTEQL